MCQELGSGAMMAKVDLKNALRFRREDWHLLRVYRHSRFYIDRCLPFGLRSASYLFNLVAEALEWIIKHHFSVQHCFNYLHDFFLAGPPLSDTCLQALSDMPRPFYHSPDTGHLARHYCRRSWITRRQALCSPTGTSHIPHASLYPSHLHQKAIIVPHRQTRLCLQGYSCWKDIPRSLV
jgi:hypothetical protein